MHTLSTACHGWRGGKMKRRKCFVNPRKQSNVQTGASFNRIHLIFLWRRSEVVFFLLKQTDIFVEKENIWC